MKQGVVVAAVIVILALAVLGSGNSAGVGAVTPSPTIRPPILTQRISFPAGWNILNQLVAPQLTNKLNNEPAYTFAAGDSEYRTVVFDFNHPPSFEFASPGYWVFLPEPMEVTLASFGVPRSPLHVNPGWTMVASNDGIEFRIVGADLVVVYEPEMATYQTADPRLYQRIPLGRGAWVYSAEGAEITFRP